MKSFKNLTFYSFLMISFELLAIPHTSDSNFVEYATLSTKPNDDVIISRKSLKKSRPNKNAREKRKRASDLVEKNKQIKIENNESEGKNNDVGFESRPINWNELFEKDESEVVPVRARGKKRVTVYRKDIPADFENRPMTWNQDFKDAESLAFETRKARQLRTFKSRSDQFSQEKLQQLNKLVEKHSDKVKNIHFFEEENQERMKALNDQLDDIVAQFYERD